ncbi:rab GTPase activator [Neocallimastix lanati (nom. inval.)]|jgi:Rab GDP dissociation inhibitor|uniref:Rab GDP dissociation inhibitor n=1 Tax=Neocallimastix californiae TaxID=1754190 RepID=A0A1Y2FJ29_9FUNG|nr:rab GTPase activator [Neocallimastix sp. JGI-2020a]ORY82815.1 rab GTPase activator [Neocallimastix californiae]|eukprot:ORY82815.1 rab GTPase activator [Neocallimastix californiae]
MDEEYDVIVLGTGLTECILSGLLSVEGKKVLHMDRNEYYGGEGASLHITQLYQKFKPGQAIPDKLKDHDRDFNVDLIPKFAMASGEFVKILIYTDVTRYTEFKQIAGSYFYYKGDIAKVPVTEKEVVLTSLIGMAEKLRLKSFFEFIQAYDETKPETHQGLDLNTVTMKEVYEKFELEPATMEFIGHALALQIDNGYLERPAKETYDKIMLYMLSMSKYGKSPYLYPLYGLDELPQGFARLSAIYGGTYMLNKKVDEIVYENGKVVGVKSEGEVAKCKKVICDPSYAKDKVTKVGQVVRAIVIMEHPIANTDDADSVQVIIPQTQVGRSHDIYIASVSSNHNVCPKGFYIAIVSTIVETGEPEQELEPGIKLLGEVVDKFVYVSDIYAPSTDGTSDNLFISKSNDATSHFETVSDDVKDLYKRVIGKELTMEGKVARGDEN